MAKDKAIDKLKVKRALLSVSDKTGIIGLARFLVDQGVEIVSTGGTAKALADAGIAYTNIEAVTGNPEAFGGRMKTISFQVASALLFRRGNESDEGEARALGIRPIDFVACNLYPFAEAVRANADDDALLEKIDVGGPTMVRAAAKNFYGVAVCVDPADYARVMGEMESSGGELSLATRRELALKAFQLTADYDVTIAEELGSRYGTSEKSQWLRLTHGKELRYGENPHQRAFYFRTSDLQGASHAITSANIIQGKPLSYNNIRDADAAHRAASDAWLANSRAGSAVAIVKHMNPCGLGVADDSLAALKLAWAGDPVSAFGSVICFTGEVGLGVADWLADKFVEVIVAPYIVPEALQRFAQKKNMRILLCPPRPEATGEKSLVSVSGGVLVQEEDEGLDSDFRDVTRAKFPKERLRLAQFGVIAAKHLKSNAIALVRQTAEGWLQLVGAGMGQPNRVDCIRALAGPRAREKGETSDLLLASDAFFPFADNIEFAAELGVKLIVQPGGSLRDEEVIRAADERGIAMVFTGRRHFRH